MAQAPRIPQVQTESRTDNLLQTNIISGIDVLLKSPLAVTSRVQDQALISGSTSVNHGMTQIPSGYLITKINAAATIYDTAFTATTVTLVSSAAVTCDILFF